MKNKQAFNHNYIKKKYNKKYNNYLKSIHKVF